MSNTLDLFDHGMAALSSCRRYRYCLRRSWGSRDHRCVFVMVNPSTADETEDDPTIRKCMGFAKRWGFGALDVVNLFAWRATDVTELLRVDDPVGPDNDTWIASALASAATHRVVVAWGRHNARVARMVRDRAATLHAALGAKGVCLGRNGDGTPRHPLMLAYATRLEPWGTP